MRPRLLIVIRLFLATLLTWAGVLKVVDPAAFASAIMGFRLTSVPIAAALALYIPWLELILAGSLLVPRWRTGALLVTASLFTLFAVLWAVTWIRGIDVACGCFGGHEQTSPAWSLVRTLGPGLAAWWSLRMHRNASL